MDSAKNLLRANLACGFPKKLPGARQGAVASRKLGRRAAPMGAVRLHSDERKIGRQLGKVSVVVLLAAGTSGILATASTGNVTASNFKATLLTTVKQSPAPLPTFRFDDADSVASSELHTPLLAAASPGMPRSQAFTPHTFASLLPEPSN